MPLASYGYEEVCHIAQEVTYGAQAPSGFRSFRTLSFGLISDDMSHPRPAATGRPVEYTYTAGSAPGPREIKLLPKVRGRIVLEADWEDVGLLLKQAMFDTPTQVLAAGVLTATYDTPIVAALPQQSFTICREVGSTFTAKDMFFLGCYIDTMRLVFAEDQPVRVEMDIIGQRMVFGTAPAATFSATPWMEYHEHEVRINATPSGTPPVSGDKLTDGLEPITTTLFVENRLRAIGAGGIGVRGIRKPLPRGHRRIGMTFRRDFASTALLDAYYAEGAAGYVNASVVATSDSQIPGGGGVFFDFFAHFAAGRVIGPPPGAPGGPDIIPEEITIIAAANESASGEIATAVLHNGGSATEYNDAV